MKKTCNLNFSTGEAPKYTAQQLTHPKIPRVSQAIMILLPSPTKSYLSKRKTFPHQFQTNLALKLASNTESCSATLALPLKRNPVKGLHLTWCPQPAHVPSGEPGGSLVIAGR